MKRVGPIAMLSTEPVIIGLIAAIYLLAAWILRLHQATYAGEGEGVFDVLVYADTVAVVGSVYVAAATAFGGYAEIDRRARLPPRSALRLRRGWLGRAAPRRDRLRR
jgi:hypothetical protein